MFKIKKLLKGDYMLWLIIMALLFFSVVVVYSSAVSLDKGDYGHNARMQFFYVFVGLFVIWFISTFISPSWVVRISRPLVVFFLILSAMVYIPHIGPDSHGVNRWISLPFIRVSFCPFDFLRIFVIVDLAAQLTKRAGSIGKMYLVPDFSKIFVAEAWKPVKELTLPVLWPSIAAMCVMAYSNISTAGIIFIMVMVMLKLGNIHKREWRKILAYAVLAGGLLLAVMVTFGIGRGETIKTRIIGMFTSSNVEKVEKQSTKDEEFVSHESVALKMQKTDKAHYQKEMARAAVASGGLFGKGPGNSTLRSQLPHAYDDCVFAFIVEEYGMVGGVLVIGAFLWLLIKGGIIARRSRYYAFTLISYGIVIHIFLTAVINMLVSVGIFVTGQSLPLISRGGSAIVAHSVALGLLLAISACPTRDPSSEPVITDQVHDSVQEEAE